MENFKILHIGKFLFWLSFILGNIALFGYIISGNGVFQIIGFLLLTYGTVINLIAFSGLLLFGIFAPKYTTDAIKSALILLINIPIAILYFYIGISI
ncbi:hypothetical protein PQ459_18365 [Chryseobacterium sp. KACC 21268]|nr:hypothetical protein PQ459_18365 [Chryseobacterium sp. KACC 21268]